MQDIVQWNYGSWPDGLPKKGGANALSGAGSLDTATTCPTKTPTTKNFIIEYLGSLGETEGWREVIHRRKRCDLSLFQLGLRVLEHFLNEELPIPVQFHVII